jgi:hypothetical protein
MNNNELEVLKKTVYKLSQRVANLTLDLDLAHAQIELMTKQQQEKETKAE